MLDLPRYLLGVAEILLLGGFATLGASALRARLLPSFTGPPAHLATVVVALALLIWIAELLGSVGLFAPVPYAFAVGLAGLGLRLGLGGGWGGPSGAAASSFSPRQRPRTATSFAGEKPSKREGPPHPPPQGEGPGTNVAMLVALVVAALAVVKFGADVRVKLGTGMTGFDSTWYHGPFAAGFFQSGSTWDMHFIAPQFLAWFYPANAEILHSIGMLAFGRDILSPLLNLGWFVGCLVACWCIGRPYGVAPWSLALGAIALSLPVLADQAGEARNDIVGIFFLLSAVAVALDAFAPPRQHVFHPRDGKRVGVGGGEVAEAESGMGALAVVGLAAGLAAGTKLNFLLPAAVLVLGLTLVAPAGRRWRALAVGGLAAVAGGGYWYLRNLIHAGNPLPWFDSLGPISLPAPDQALGGREGHSVLGYLTDGAVWSDWFLPGLREGLTILWPVLLVFALGGLSLGVISSRGSLITKYVSKEPRDEMRGGERAALRLVGLVGLAAALAWLIAPTSASGPEGMPRGFESGLRYLAPALVLGMALVPVVLSARLRDAGMGHLPNGRILKVPRSLARHLSGRETPHARSAALLVLGVLAIVLGYPVQRHYLENRYANPTFATPGLDAAFRWADDISNARIATTSTRQYPLYGTDLSNHVQYIGEEQPNGGFTAPNTCPQWRRLLNAGHYDYVVTSRDRMEPGKPPYPASARWTEGLGAEEVLRQPPTAVFKLKGPLDPSSCRP